MISLKSLRDYGFINYYGLQRFGTRSISSHAVGKEILSERWENAINLIMAPKEGGK